MEWEVIISAIVGVAGVIVGAVVTNAFNRKKISAEIEKLHAETEDIVTQSALKLIEPLKKRLEEVEAELADYVSWAARLVRQIKDKGDEPVPFVRSKREQP